MNGSRLKRERSRQQPQYPGLPFVFCFLLGCIVFYQLQWAFDHYPQLPRQSPFTRQQLTWWLSFAWGAFALYVGQPIVKGRLRIFTHPTKYVTDQVIAQFLSWRIVLVLFGCSLAICVSILSFPMIHITHDADTAGGEQPIVIAGGHPRHFVDGVVSISNEYVGNIVLIGERGVYRIDVRSEDVERAVPFFTHKTIGATELVPSQPLAIAIVTTDDRPHLQVRSDDYMGTAAFGRSMTALYMDDWFEVVDTILDKLSADPAVRLRVNRNDSLVYKGRSYNFSYSLGETENELRIVVPTIQSAIGNRPIWALEALRRMSPEERERDIAQFESDVRVLSPEKREEVFSDLLQAPKLRERLRGTPGERLDALEYVERVVSLGTSDLTPDSISGLVEAIVSENFALTVRPDIVVGAMRAVEKVSQGEDVLRGWVLNRIGVLVDSINDRNNSRKAEMARILLEFADDDTSEESVDQIVSILTQIYRSVRSLESVEQAIQGAIADRRQMLEHDEIRRKLRSVYTEGG